MAESDHASKRRKRQDRPPSITTLDLAVQERFPDALNAALRDCSIFKDFESSEMADVLDLLEDMREKLAAMAESRRQDFRDPDCKFVAVTLSIMTPVHLPMLNVMETYRVVPALSLLDAVRVKLGAADLRFSAELDTLDAVFDLLFSGTNATTEMGCQMKIECMLRAAMRVVQRHTSSRLFLLPQLQLAVSKEPEEFVLSTEEGTIHHVTHVTGSVDYALATLNQSIVETASDAVKTIKKVNMISEEAKLIRLHRDQMNIVVLEAKRSEFVQTDAFAPGPSDAAASHLKTYLPQAIGQSLILSRRTASLGHPHPIPLCISDGSSWLFGHLILAGPGSDNRFQCVYTVLPGSTSSEDYASEDSEDEEGTLGPKRRQEEEPKTRERKSRMKEVLQCLVAWTFFTEAEIRGIFHNLGIIAIDERPI